jgi:Tfp pilus assembly protein PilO
MKINFIPMIEKFNKLESRVRYGSFVVILLAIFMVDLFTMMKFQWAALQKIGRDNQALRVDIDRLKVDLKGIDQKKIELKDSRSQMEAMNIKIRSITEVSSIQEDISRIASGSGIKIEQLTPQSASQRLLVSSGGVKYYVLPIMLQATSGFHKFGHFIGQLESESLMLTTSNLSIEDQGGDINHHNIKATFKVVLSDKNMGG